MDFDEFLRPVSVDLQTANYSPFQTGSHIRFNIDEEIDADSIVFIATDEMQDFNDLSGEEADFDPIRDHFYRLSVSNWNRKIYDLGTLYRGATFEDSCFALHQVVNQLVEIGATVVLTGGSQALNYILYKALQKDLVKAGTIDIKLDIEAETEDLNAGNHITRMILDETHRLLEFRNIGSQVPYVAKEESDILEQLNFEDLRLGKLIQEFDLAEPILRDLDLLSVDMNVMQHSAFGSAVVPTSNGLNEREICGLMNYAGLSSELKVLHLSNFINLNASDNILLAEMLWYFTEARNNLKSDGDIRSYRVQSEEGEIVFLHSGLSDRWWIQAGTDGQYARIPCSEKDYADAMKGGIPDKWLKFYKKFY